MTEGGGGKKVLKKVCDIIFEWPLRDDSLDGEVWV